MKSNFSAQYWRTQLQLTHHVEGGSFREVYRSSLILPQSALTSEHKADRNASTSIYFLLEYGEFSAFHKIASDEIWHFYDGATLCIYEIGPDGILQKHLLGTDIAKGASPQIVIPTGSWFASRCEVTDEYTLCGCTVAPGFDFADFELADRQSLIQQYPQHTNIITSLTR